nr:gustatory receptor 30.2 [Papilio machaon]
MATTSDVLLFPSNSQNQFSRTFILDNCLDDDLQKFLYPLNLVENVLFLSKYSIRDNFITSNNSYARFYSYFSTIFIIFIYILIICLDKGIRTHTPDVLALEISNYVVIIIGRFVYNFTNNGFSDSHVNFIISIQRIQRTLKIKYKNLTLYNWVYFFVIFSFYIIFFITQTYAKRGTPYVFFYYVILLIDDFNALYLIRTNKLLLEYTILFESKLKTVKNFDMNPISNGRLREESLDTMFKVFLEMSKATGTHKHLSEIPTFYRSIHTAIYTLTCVEFIYSKYESLLKECSFTYEKMTTSLVLSVDAKLPLTLLSVCVTYTVVLLQFAFH